MITSRERLWRTAGMWIAAGVFCALPVLYVISPVLRVVIVDKHIKALISGSFLIGPFSAYSAGRASLRRVVVAEHGIREVLGIGTLNFRERQVAWTGVQQLDVRSSRLDLLGITVTPAHGHPVHLGFWQTNLRAVAVLAAAHVPEDRWSPETSLSLERIESGAV